MDLGISGLASNFDWRSLIDQMSDIERTPQKRLLVEQDTLEQRNNAYGSILTQLSVFQTRVDALKSPDLYTGKVVTTADPTAASATASAAAAQGSYTFDFTQLATSARQLGQVGAGKPLNADADVSGLVISAAGFSTPVTAGTFRVNGAEVSIAATDTLEEVFERISTATGGEVTASYDPSVDRIKLTSGDPIVLGTATDTSNFLQVAKLHNNGSEQIASSGELGGVRMSTTLGSANLAGALDFGGSGTGKFRINGVDIEFTAADKIESVLKRINDSAAGVSASYDSLDDRFILANRTTGDVGVAMEDVNGNFLAATRLSGGTLERGKDLLYTINDGGELRSHSNTIQEASSGIAGLNVTALKEASTTQVSVGSNTGGIKKAITDFVDAYNDVQDLIASQSASSTAADGKVTAEILATDGEAESIASTLRRLTYGSVQGLGLDLTHLEALGIQSNSNDDTLKLSDDAKLDDALANRLEDVKSLWADDGGGLAVRLGKYLEKTIGDNGTLVAKQELITKQASGFDLQIADLERVVQANRSRLIDSFVAMERAQANINQQMQFLNQRFGTS